MNAQPLNSTESQGQLQFADVAACKRWVEQLPLTNVQQAQQALSLQLLALVKAEVPAIERLRILEALRAPVTYVQGETANRYAGKPIPLEAGELEAWSSVTEIWTQLEANYQKCLQSYRDGDLDIAPHAALITLRLLTCVSRQMMEHFRVYRAVPEALWRALNGLYAFSEQHGFARIRVQDAFSQQEPDSSCAEQYLQALLVHLANPYALSIRQLAFVHDWSEKWATLVGLAQQPLPASAGAALAVDLGSAAGAAFATEIAPQASVRHLDLEQLSKTLRQTITLLNQGQTPAQLGLGETARQPGCENLLMLLYVQWCRAGTGRGEERESADERVSVCFGISSAHFQVSGRKEFRQPAEITSREKRDLDTYGYVLQPERQPAERSAEAIEVWNILNQSPGGFMCILRDPTSKSRIAHNQLVAVQRRGTRGFQVGMVQWLRVEREREISLGVRIFPGEPQAVAVRPSNFTPGSSTYERALLLPEVPASATPATFILPPGWFQSGRFIETQTDGKQVAKLLNLLEMGSDFDRCTITVI
ncbi:MAG: hypothetical protein ACT4PS_08610 [Betaproteobacteria bacterium]